MTLVREQRFEYGRDALLQPPANVHRRLVNGDTGLTAKQAVYEDGRLWLDGIPRRVRSAHAPRLSGGDIARSAHATNAGSD